jgi:murein DD-endopeptidase MepM/ murein hydrolase activator NlpD
VLLVGALIIAVSALGAQAASAAAPTTPGASSSSSTASGGVLANPGASGYVNPFAAVKTAVTKERVDMGWDFHTGGAGDPILSVGNAKVTAILPNWYAGQPLIMTQLLSGPDAGKFIYYAEGLTPTVAVGDVVKAGQQIATTTSQPSGLEFGWGGNASGATLQQVQDPTAGDATTSIGLSFQSFLTSLGL